MKKTIGLVILAFLLAATMILSVSCNPGNANPGKTNDPEAEAARSEAESLRAQLQDAVEELQNNKEFLTDLIRRVDYRGETVYVIGHKTPDSDTVCSAIGMAFLLNSLGISAEARIPDALNLESQYVFSELELSVPAILEDAAGKQLWLVDHSASSQMVVGADRARIVGVTDHHGIGDVETTEPICVLSCPAGSTCSLVSELCAACDVELPQDVAGALLAGILSDTANMKSSDVTKLDETALERLKTASGISDTDALFAGMLDAKLSFRGMDDRQIFYSDYKDYDHNGVRYGIGCVKVARVEELPVMAARLQAVIVAELRDGCDADFLLYHLYVPDYSKAYTGIVGKEDGFPENLMSAAFGGIMERQGEYYVCAPSLSRKAEIVPRIDAYLDTLRKTD